MADRLDNLTGEVDVGLRGVAAVVGIPVRVAGTVDEPQLRPTTAALAGAAAGTVILGPGLGTVVGVKAGQAVKRFTRFVKRTSKERKTNTRNNASDKASSGFDSSVYEPE